MEDLLLHRALICKARNQGWKLTNEAAVRGRVLGPGRDSIVEDCKDFVCLQLNKNAGLIQR